MSIYFTDIEKFDEAQPRVPAGSPDGGQWTSAGMAGIADGTLLPTDMPQSVLTGRIAQHDAMTDFLRGADSEANDYDSNPILTEEEFQAAQQYLESGEQERLFEEKKRLKTESVRLATEQYEEQKRTDTRHLRLRADHPLKVEERALNRKISENADQLAAGKELVKLLNAEEERRAANEAFTGQVATNVIAGISLTESENAIPVTEFSTNRITLADRTVRQIETEVLGVTYEASEFQKTLSLAEPIPKLDTFSMTRSS